MTSREQASALPVKKCVLEGEAMIGVAMSDAQLTELKRLLEATDGGREEQRSEAQVRNLARARVDLARPPA